MDLIATKAAAEVLGVSVRTLNRWAAAGRIVPAYKGEGPRGEYVYDPAEVERVKKEAAA